MRLRVVWGLLETMAIFSPTSALVRLDLPTLGRPQTVIMAVFLMSIEMILNFLELFLIYFLSILVHYSRVSASAAMMRSSCRRIIAFSGPSSIWSKPSRCSTEWVTR